MSILRHASLACLALLAAGSVGAQPPTLSAHGPRVKVAATPADSLRRLVFAAAMSGNSAKAIAASQRVAQAVTADLVRDNPALEPALAVPLQTLVTFGRWAEVLASPLPPTALRIAIAHGWYARGVAFAATGRMPEARATVDSIEYVTRGIPQGDARITLEIAAITVTGEIALRSGDAVAALRAFTQAAALEDRLAPADPPSWYYPVRHSLGKALLAADRPRDAEAAYRADLRRYPENVWSLRGLALALAAQGRAHDAAEVERRLSKAWRQADIKPASSRY